VDRDVEKGCISMSREEKNNIAWQYHGYPALTKWMASSNDFFLLRRFSPLQVRCLLHLQNQIAQKGKELDAWDTFAMCQEPEKGNSGWIDDDPEALPGNPRPRILREVLPLLKDYSESFKNLSYASSDVLQTDGRSR
jgi:hypothetical protein